MSGFVTKEAPLPSTVKLIHGDCLDVLRKMKDKSVDAVVTDPPYGIGFLYRDGKEVASTPDDYAAFLLPIVAECKRVARDGAFFAVWQTQLNFRYFWDWFGDGIHIYVAAKNFVQMRKTAINYGYDPVVMWYQDGDKLRPNSPKRSVDYHVGDTASIVSDPSRIEKGHPCPRPLDTVKTILKNFTKPKGDVFDPFMGSGTTGVACVMTGRNFIGIEIDEGYFKIAERRIKGAPRRA